ncbi:MAG: CAP domain-containing protein [Leptolyngbya sp. LCM1.Bin17]|nr:MAG: CAP domain-containing protein [Leptolyngbya sp. LCM1.Bin17]
MVGNLSKWLGLGAGSLALLAGGLGNPGADLAAIAVSHRSSPTLEVVPAQHLSQAEDPVVAELLTRVNQARQQAGVDPLSLNPQLNTAAQGHAQDMASTGRLSHTGSDGSTMRSRIDATDYRWRAIGENVAMGQPTAAAVLESWLNSPGHRQNLLNPTFTELGLGWAEAGGRLYWVQVFAQPL